MAGQTLKELAEQSCTPSRELVEAYVKASPEERKTFDLQMVENAIKHIYMCLAPIGLCTQLWHRLYEKQGVLDPNIAELVMRPHQNYIAGLHNGHKGGE